MARQRGPWIALGSITACLAIAGIGVGLATAKDPRLDQCPVVGNKVLASFEIPSARAYQSSIPRMLRSPELEVDSPAFVVIFDGLTTLPILAAPPGVDAAGNVMAEQQTPTAFDGVVCIVTDGKPTVYTDVDITGWKAP